MRVFKCQVKSFTSYSELKSDQFFLFSLQYLPKLDASYEPSNTVLVMWVIIHFEVWWCKATQPISCESSLLAEVICFIKSEAHFNWPTVSLMFFINYYIKIIT